jgi:hypothetical protein
MACFTAVRSSGEVFALVAIASCAAGRIWAGATAGGRSGIVGAAEEAAAPRGAFGAPLLSTPEDGIDEVVKAGDNGESDIGSVAFFVIAPRAASFGGASDFSAGRGRGSGIASDEDAAQASPASTPIASKTSMSRMALTGTTFLCCAP